MTALAQGVDWLTVGPAVLTAVTALVVLVADLWLPRRAAVVLTTIAVAGALTALVLVGVLWGDARRTFCIAGSPVALESCSYVVNQITLVFQAVVLVGTIVVLLLAHRDEVSGPNPLPPGETGFLILASATGALVLAAGRDLATIVVALEVVSLPAFALVGLRRRDPRGARDHAARGFRCRAAPSPASGRAAAADRLSSAAGSGSRRDTGARSARIDWCSSAARVPGRNSPLACRTCRPGRTP